MKGYRRLTLGERYQISALRKSGLGLRSIGRVLNRSGSTVLRELDRNRDQRMRYGPLKAHRMARKRRKEIHPPRKIEGFISQEVSKRLREQWSPEQISCRLKIQGIELSHETIYRWIYEDYVNGGELWQELRRHRKQRRSHGTTRNLKRSGTPRNLPWIDSRPKVAEKRIRLGDYERDIMLGKRVGPALLTIVDRTSRLTRLQKVERITWREIHRATLKGLRSLPLRTITNDNGREFLQFQQTKRALKVPIYFNHPYSAWERGTNENTNGLVRQYFPKNCDFKKVPPKAIQRVEWLLNNRPRKCLAFQTPLEVHNKLSRTVALSD